MLLKWILFAIFGLFVFNYSAGAQYPGARLILTSKALDYASSLLTPLLKKKLAELVIPDIHDTTRVKIGRIKYTISNIRFEGFSIASSTISSNTNGVTFQLSNVALKSNCKWKYKRKHRPHIGHHGRVEIKIKNSAIKLTVLVTKSADGHPIMKATNCEVDLHLSIHVHGSGSWLYKLFQSKLERELKKTLKTKICEKVYATATEWSSAISSYPLSKTVNDFTITYGLLNNPVFSTNQIQLDLEGEVKTMPLTVRDAPLQLPAIENKNKMMHLLLTDKFFATAITATIHSGLLNYKVTPDLFSSELKLNTLFFKPVVPKLFQQFPDLPVVLVIGINKYQEINLDLHGAHISLLGDFVVEVIQENETTFKAFSVELEIRCTLIADILQPNNKPSIVLEATDIHISLGKLTSSVGDFETTSLEHALDGMSFLLMPIINEYGKKGFTIPSMDRVNFIDPSITFLKDCVQVSTDFKYSL